MCRGCAVFSPCEVRRHASAESCWLVAGRDVFDVTSFLPRHPAGTRSIVRKAGGADCTEDLGFHSAKAQKLWMQHKIGRLEPCGAEKNPDNAVSGLGAGNCVIGPRLIVVSVASTAWGWCGRRIAALGARARGWP